MSATNTESLPKETVQDSQQKTEPVVDVKQANTKTEEKLGYKPGSALSNKQRTSSRRLPEIPEKQADLIQVGDICVAFFNPFHQKLFDVRASGLFDTKYGHYNYTDMIGKPFGTMVSLYFNFIC